MGSETAETPEVSTEETPVVVEPVESENAAEASEVPDGEEQQEPVDVEVVLQGANGSQPDKQHEIDRIVTRRVRKLNAKNAKTEDRASDAEQQLANAQERIKIYELALSQRTIAADTPPPPDPEHFDDGVRDPKYAQALNQYNQPLIAEEVRKQTANLAPVQQETVDPGLERKQRKHYERASELGAKDFDEIEDAAIGILGKETVNHVISEFEESELLVYFLGTKKNQGKAEEIAELIKTNPIKGVAELGRLSAKLVKQPKGINETTPDPDDEIPGGNPSVGKKNKFQIRVDKAREEAGDGRKGGMKAILDIKKEAQEAGVTVN